VPSADVYWKKERNIKKPNRCENARARFLWGKDFASVLWPSKRLCVPLAMSSADDGGT